MFAAKNELFTRPSGGYVIPRSLRFRSSASAYLNRTFGTPTDSTKFTYSTWMKRGQLDTLNTIVRANSTDYIQFSSSATIQLVLSNVTQLTTTPVFRDSSAWGHFVVSYNNAASPKWNLYWNNLNIGTSTASNTTFDTAVSHGIGQDVSGGGGKTFDGYFADVNFIDGQTLTPTSFGATNAITGVWAPIKYAGTYGTNGFHLDFNSYATTAALGTDTSGNGNTWTVNNISVTAGVTYDSMIDVPTVGTTGSNYCVLNPLRPSSNTASGGNLNIVIATSETGLAGTMQFPPSKSYFEEQFSTTTAAAVGAYLGVCNADVVLNGAANYGLAGVWSVICTAAKNRYNNGSLSGSAAGATANTVTLQIAVDNVTSATDTYVWFGADNVFYDSSMGTTGNPSTGANPTFTITNKVLFPHFSGYQNTISANFGQRPFTYTPPSGYSALNTYNLPTPTILKGNTVMDATLYTGTGASLSVTNAAGFQPDFVWMKGRSGATDHALYDSVRGATIDWLSNTNAAETTQVTGLTAFGSTGFTVGALAKINTNAATYVGWQWKGSGTTVSNTTGSITSTVCVNPTAGFSVVGYTSASGTTQSTIGHGLGVTPSLIITKSRSSASFAWSVFHASVCTTTSLYLSINTTGALATYSTIWGAALPTSSVFGITSGGGVVASTACLAYCFAPIAGYSAFGSYVANNVADGPFVYLGFRPRFIMFKDITGVADWEILDTARSTFNLATAELKPNTVGAETTGTSVDFLSNGFKLRAGAADPNNLTHTYIYAAFAESPFKNSLAR